MTDLMSRRRRALALAYQRVFMPDGKLTRDAEIVLADLRDKGFAHASTFDIDPRIACVKEGQRRMWLHINDFLMLDADAVQKLVEVDDGGRT